MYYHLHQSKITKNAIIGASLITMQWYFTNKRLQDKLATFLLYEEIEDTQYN